MLATKSLIVGADAFQIAASYKYLCELIGHTQIFPTGVVSVGEFIEMIRGTWEVHTFLQGNQYLVIKSHTQDTRKEYMDDGVSSSSEEAK